MWGRPEHRNLRSLNDHEDAEHRPTPQKGTSIMLYVFQRKEEEMFVRDALNGSEQTFGSCALGDERRTKRLVDIGSRIARSLKAYDIAARYFLCAIYLASTVKLKT